MNNNRNNRRPRKSYRSDSSRSGSHSEHKNDFQRYAENFLKGTRSRRSATPNDPAPDRRAETPRRSVRSMFSKQSTRLHDEDYNPHAKYSKKKQLIYKKQQSDPNTPVRLNRFIANAGLCSRREADEYIKAGIVSVNGQVVTEMGFRVVPAVDKVLFHDQPIRGEKLVYVLLNKPKDVVTTTDDPHARMTVMDLVRGACKERIYPVGRLDRNTTGVLLLTNDGDLAQRLLHPRYEHKKIYQVTLDKPIDPSELRRLEEGIELEEGTAKADEVHFLDEKRRSVGIEIHIGWNRIVRRMFEAIGAKVIRLDRVYFCGLTKNKLPRGRWRMLTDREVAFLKMQGHASER